MPRPPARDQLLDAAARLFYADGIAATGVDAVARAAGVTKPTLYAHFASKAELVTATLEARHARRARELEAWIARQADPLERLLAVFGYLAAFYDREGEGERGCAFLNAAAELPAGDPATLAAVAAEKDWLLERLASLARDAGLAEPERLASQLLLLVDGIAGRVVVHGRAAAPGAVADAERAARALVASA
jgi:AcrR family transcriptional regulator